MYHLISPDSLLLVLICNSDTLRAIGLQYNCSLNVQTLLTFEAPNTIAADDILFFYFYLSKKIRLDFSYESPASRGFT